MGTELMACPFCGSSSLFVDMDSEGWYIECNGCLSRGPSEGSQEEAEAAWNKRA